MTARRIHHHKYNAFCSHDDSADACARSEHSQSAAKYAIPLCGFLATLAGLGCNRSTPLGNALESPVACVANCFHETRAFASTQVGMDPNDPTVRQAQSPAELVGVLVTECQQHKATFSRVRVAELLEHVTRSNHCQGILAASNGHLYVLLGVIEESNTSLYQTMHGQADIFLWSKEQILAKHFSHAWLITPGKANVQVAVGSSLLRVANINRNFGKVAPNEVLTHSVAFKNTGPKSIVFKTVHTSCGCTTASGLQNSVLPPGAANSLDIEIATRNTPFFRESVYVTVEEPESSTSRHLRVMLLGNQCHFKLISPSHLDFGEMQTGRTYSRRLSVTETHNDRFECIGLETNGLPITWSQTQSKDGRGLRTYAFNLDFTPRAGRIGRRTSEIQVHTDSDISPVLPVPVAFEVASSLRIVPSAIALGNVEAGERLHRVIRFTTAKDTPIYVTTKRVPPEATVSIKANGGFVEMHVAVTLDSAGLWRGQIIAEVDDGRRRKSVRIPCVGLVEGD